VQNFGLKIPDFGTIWDKIKIFSTRNLFCQKFAVGYRKTKTAATVGLLF